MDADTDSQGYPAFSLHARMQVFHHRENAQASPYGALGIIFMGVGIAKIHQQSIPKELGNVAIKAGDNLSARVLIRTDNVAKVLGIELSREGRGIYQVTEHDGELAAFGVSGT